jgi:A/G-specific adenine glycosylase
MFHKKPPQSKYRRPRGASARFRIPVFSEAKLAAQIVKWFRANQRDLPWRRTRDPYAIWLSEVMLQQTQVKTVIPYWERWMRELPTIADLASADPDLLLKLWEGLGYYSRARNLQRAAQQIIATYAGQFPSELAQILELPGIGRYTAGAIASIAFGQPTPIVDGNVARVLTRHFGLRGDPKSKFTNTALWSLAEKLVQSTGACSDLNQGLMELGATICLPRQPLCASCPIKRGCFALRNDLTQFLPEIPQRPSPTPRIFRATLIRRNGHILLQKRPDGVVNSGFWELPNAEVKDASKSNVLCRIKHTITRYRMTLEVVVGKKFTLGGKWVSREALSGLPLVNSHRKALQKLGLMPPSKTKPAKNLMELPQTCAKLGYQM